MHGGFVYAYICIQRNVYVHGRYLLWRKYVQVKKAIGNLYLRAFCIFSLAFNLPFHCNVTRRLHATLQLLGQQRFSNLWTAVVITNFWLLLQATNVSNIYSHSRFYSPAEILFCELRVVSCSERYQPCEQVMFPNNKREGAFINVLSAFILQISLKPVATISLNILLSIYRDLLPSLRV